MEVLGKESRKIFISGNIIDEVMKAIMHNGFECTIVPNGVGFTITYDDNNIRFIEKQQQEKIKEYDAVCDQVKEVRSELAKLCKEVELDKESNGEK